MMIKVSSSSKVILFGEHSVVYGYEAIVSPISLKTYGCINTTDKYDNLNNKKNNNKNINNKTNFNNNKKNFNDFNNYFNNSFNNSNNNKILLNLININKKIEISNTIEDILSIDSNNYDVDCRYSVVAIKNTLKYLLNKNIIDKDSLKPFEMTIYSGIPVSCGLGSSASVSSTIIKGFLKANSISLPIEDIIKITYSTEKEVQGRGSITDSASVNLNRMLRIKDGKYAIFNNKKIIDILKSCKLLVVYVEKRLKKTKDILENVSKNPKKDEIFKSINGIIDELEDIESPKDIGNLMVQNHQLLKDLGVSTEKLDKVVEIGKKYAYGGKLSGAGGGGIVIILCDNENIPTLKDKLNNFDVINYWECDFLI